MLIRWLHRKCTAGCGGCGNDETYERMRADWRGKGIGWYSDDSKTVALYRQYNPHARTGTHNYTRSKVENDWLVKLGWRAEGIGWYGA